MICSTQTHNKRDLLVFHIVASFCTLTLLYANVNKALARDANALPCLQVEVAPVIDGSLDDPCWEDAATATDFSSLESGGYRRADRQTSARVVYDNEYLYIAVTCFDSGEESVLMNVTERDAAVYKDDCIELFFADTDDSSIYYHLAINSLGAVYDARLADSTWDGTFVLATKQYSDRWVLEAAIPHATLGGQMPQAQETRGFNVARGHHIDGTNPSYSTWAALSGQSFHLPQEFALLRYTQGTVDPVLMQMSNIKNDVTANFDPDEAGQLSSWELADGTEYQPEMYLSDIYTIRNRTDRLIARQSVNVYPLNSSEFQATIEAKGSQGASAGLRVLYETEGGDVINMPVIWNEPLTNKFVTFEKTVKIPADAHRLLAVELHRSNGKGEIVYRGANFTRLTDTFAGIKDATDYMTKHRLPVSDPAPAIDPVHWAASLQGGSLHVLCVLDGSLQRGVEELAQRLDMDYDLVWLKGGSYYAYGADTVNARLRRESSPYEVILISAAIADKALIKTIANNVKAGSGLVFLTGPDFSKHDPAMLSLLPDLQRMGDTTQQTIASGVPWQYFPTVPANYVTGHNPAEPAVKQIGLASHEDGRTVTIIYGGPAGTYNGLLPHSGLNEVALDRWWEYAYSLLGKSMMYAANRPSVMEIEEIKTDLETERVVVRLTSLQNARGTLKLAWANQPTQAKAYMESHPVETESATTVEFAIPDQVLRQDGLHVANLFLETESRHTLDWATVAFEIAGSKRLANHRPFDQMAYRGVNTIPVVLRVENDDSTSGELQITARLIDSHDRTAWATSREVTIASQSMHEVTVDVSLDRVVTVGHRLEVTLWEAGTILDQKSWDVNVLGPWDSLLEDFHSGVYGDFYRRSHTDDVFMRWIRAMGFDFVVEGGVLDNGPQLNAPWHDSNIAAQAYHHHEGVGERSIRNPCLSDLDYLAELTTQTVAAAGLSLDRGALLLSMADEAELIKDGRIELCFGPHCTAHFQLWTADHYESLDALNAQWGTDLTTWEQVQPITAEQVRERGNYAQWVDFRTFMEEVFVSAYAQVRDAVHEKYPGTQISLGNHFRLNPFSGADHFKLAQAEDFYCKYMRPDVIKEYRSFGPAKLMQTHWGYQEKLPYTRWYPWYFAMHGGDVMNYYDTFSYHGKYDLFDGTFRHTARSRAITRINEELTTGIGKILSHTPPAPNPVAILYSQNSMKVAWIESDAKVGREVWSRRIMEKLPVSDPFALHTKSIAQFKSMVKESWLQPDMIAPSQILNGQLADYRVLILPCTMALSKDVLHAIEMFVKNGGTVVADLRLALFDEHGKPMPERDSLQRVFGIKRESDTYFAEQDVLSFRQQTSENSPGRDVRVHSLAREKIVATTAKIMGRYQSGTPAIMVNALGDGQAIYLNLFTESGGERQVLMNQILHWAGVDRPWTLAADNDPALGYECFEYVQDETQYLGVLRDMAPQEGQTIEWFDVDFRRAQVSEEPLRIQSPQSGYVYDVRGGQYLGLADAFDVVFEQGEAKVFAIVPSRIEGIGIQGLKSHYVPGDHVTFAVELVADGPVDSVIRIEVYGPDDRLVDHYTKNATLDGGRYDGAILLALNDAPGDWTLKVTDVISKSSDTTTFTILEQPRDIQCE